MTPIYTPTLMEKLLGKRYKYWFVVNYYFRLQSAYKSDQILYVFASFFSFSITILIWFLLTKDNTSSIIETNQIVSYLFVGYAYNSIATTWYSEHLTRHIQSGSISNQLILPTPVFWRAFYQFVGQGVLAGVIYKFAPILFSVPFLWSFLIFPNDIFIWICLCLFIPIMFFISQTVEFIVGCVAFWTVSAGGILEINSVLKHFLIGNRIPLDLIWFPLLFQPLAFHVYHAMKMFLGEYSYTQIGFVFAGGLAWCFVLYFLANWIFRLGLKRNESVGL